MNVAGKVRGAPPAPPGRMIPMLTFSLSGLVCCVLEGTRGAATLVVSAQVTRANAPAHETFILCEVRDSALLAKVNTLSRGDPVSVEGDIEQNRRQVRELAYHSLSFVAHSVERIPSGPEGGS